MAWCWRRAELVVSLVLLAATTVLATSMVKPVPYPILPEGSLRLFHQYGCDTEGYLHIFINRWGSICNDGFGSFEATVACRQLGAWRHGSIISGESLKPRNHRPPSSILLDQLKCAPNDTQILSCAHNPIGVNDCSHAEDVYIACHNGSGRSYCPGSPQHDAVEGSLRLVDGKCAAEGRLEIFHMNVWGTICDDGFGREEAIIACRELGFDSGTAIKAPSPGMGPIWLDDLTCTLQHRSIAECGASRYGREDCSHSEDIGVHCFNSSSTVDCFKNPLPGDGAIRLNRGECSFEGRLEVWHEHHWGTVCDTGFSDIEATTMCRELGHKYGWIHTSMVADDGAKIWVKDVNCSSKAQSFFECKHSGWGVVNGCDHNKDVGVICSNTTTKVSCAGEEINHADGDLRLVDGGCAAHGRLEVYHSGRWGTICDDSFTDVAATVSCQQLGYNLGFMKAAPAGSGITWLDNVVCPASRGPIVLSSSRLADVCSHQPWGEEDCGHSEDIGVQCYNGSGSLDCQGNPFPPEGALQLTDTTCAHSGRLQIFHSGQWGTVCDTGLKARDIQLICMDLGHTDGVLGATNVITSTTRLSQTKIWLKGVACDENSTHFIDCAHETWGSTGTCDHNQDVFITCKNGTQSRDCAGQVIDFQEGQVRLIGGSNTASGRLEIFHSGRWGTVCDDSFTRIDANVACRQMGFHRGNLGSRLLAPEGTGPTWLDEVQCTETDKTLGECNHLAWGREDCSHSEDVRLSCTNITACDSNPCSNGATCQLRYTTYSCVCPAGFTGPRCETDINECQRKPCQNGGTCTDALNDYTCKCVDGYTDKNCSTDINDCQSSPCHNGASCVDRLRGFTCNCVLGYMGGTCETDINECDPIPCHSGGKCRDGVNDFTCTCKPGFSGKRCQINDDECAPNPCKNSGKCLDGNNWYFCQCPANYYGRNCENKLDAKVVPGHNTIDDTGKTAKQHSIPATQDNTTKGVAVTAILLSLLTLAVVVALVIRWKILSQSQAEPSSDGREDEAAFYENPSDKVNLVSS